ncbi:MAG: GPP34 family phosphoprotein [Gammaproteobacteria bacterium]|nr:GPP34 family phosphoprotein [Gammaproteobacteria bacterium]MXW21413.1 GPP34 family phosphoprotein [Gammaproteobacteria bacterium]MXZ28392.1 GPP34 family phosphoprotein [Gammaproteobacteria bacterium]MYF58056.1 GPP34 family phosphoprotein [Gammaproteobacteria bacterium]
MITFAEETLALLLDDKTGTFLPIGKYALEHALVGGILMDLAFADRIDTDPEQLILIDATPTGNPMLDRVLKRISESSETRDTAAWLEIISEEQGESIQEQAIESLIERGVLERREEKFLWVFRSRRYPMMDGKIQREARQRVVGVLFSGDIPDPRDIALICIADACGVLKTVFGDKELDEIAPRLDQLRKMDLIGRELITQLSVWRWSGTITRI